MNQPNLLLKVTVVASSLLLVSGLVLYRTGVLDGVLESGPATQGLLSGAGNVRPDTPGTQAPTDTGAARQLREIPTDTARGSQPFFGGSKSSPDMIRYRPFDTTKDGNPDTPRAERRDTVVRRERHMGGSKSLAPIIELPEPDTQKATPGTPRP